MLDDVRRQRFAEYLASGPFKGDRAALMRKTGYSHGRISQFLDPRQPFGERAAAELARRLSLPADYFNASAPEVVRGAAYGVSEALTCIGQALMSLEPAKREAVATTLAGWARDGGADHWRAMLVTLLDEPPTPNRHAA